eukprot:8657896-Ditylum_brightwellii.AAC.1
MKPITKGDVSGIMSSLDAPKEVVNNCALYTEVIDSLQLKPSWETLYNDDSIIHALLKQNSLHLHQVYDTPFAHDLLKSYIGEYGIGQGVKDIINGNFDPNASVNLPA